ncbi:MAG: carboxypeptidase-like regulatory domain-containing protein [bacterium]|nr:carboxypeptidase-like regulatory domain-containing protein [bacterium]
MSIRRDWAARLTGSLLALAIVACGSTATPTDRLPERPSSLVEAQDSSVEMLARVADLNQAETLPVEAVDEAAAALGQPLVAGARLEQVEASVAGGSGVFAPRRLTRIGIVRSTAEGQYLLALDQARTPITMLGQDGKRDRRIANFLNHKVMVRGVVMGNGNLLVEHILVVPTFNFVVNLFWRGRIGGVVFSTANRQGLREALVTAQAGRTGYLFRTRTDRWGQFTLGGLDPDTYTITVGLGGFAGKSIPNVSVLRARKSNLMIPLTTNN